MKMKNILKSTWKFAATAVASLTLFALPACNDNPDAYTITDGVPTVNYIRLPDALRSDSLLTHAFMGTTIALIGENMTSVKEMWFNDVKASMNSSLITNNALIVTVPSSIPANVTNMISMINKNGDTTRVAFGVDVPSPILNNLTCEYVKVGDTATINGNYILPVSGAVVPEVYFTPNLPGTVVSYNLTSIKVVVPAGATEGPVTVKSRYGATRSTFRWWDTRGMILDWDHTNASGGWRAGVISNVGGITGNYVKFSGSMAGKNAATWNEDAFSFNLWGASNGRPAGDLFSTVPANSVLKFEVYVTKTWSAGALQMIFTPWATSGTNGYIGDGTVMRGLWIPWEATGSYTTDGWITVAFPIKNFTKSPVGASLGSNCLPAGNYGGLTFFVFSGGVDGTDCTPEIHIDNIRVVPAE